MKKYMILVVALLMLAFVFVSCDDVSNPADTTTAATTTAATTTAATTTAATTTAPVPATPSVALSANKTSVNVGEKITVVVTFNALEDVKSFGLRPLFDEEYFDLVSGRMLITGALSDFSAGIGVVAFDDVVSLDGQNVMQFVLQAKKASTGESVGCEASVKGESDKAIVVSQPTDIDIVIAPSAE